MRGKCATVSNYGYGVARCTKGAPSLSQSVRGREGAKRSSQGMPGAEGFPRTLPSPSQGRFRRGQRDRDGPVPFAKRRGRGQAKRDRRGCPKRQRFPRELYPSSQRRRLTGGQKDRDGPVPFGTKGTRRERSDIRRGCPGRGGGPVAHISGKCAGESSQVNYGYPKTPQSHSPLSRSGTFAQPRDL